MDECVMENVDSGQEQDAKMANWPFMFHPVRSTIFGIGVLTQFLGGHIATFARGEFQVTALWVAVTLTLIAAQRGIFASITGDWVQGGWPHLQTTWRSKSEIIGSHRERSIAIRVVDHCQ